MAVRPIDANAMLSELRPVSFEAEHSAVLLSDVSKMMREWVERQPTLTPPNEPLTLDELRQMDGQPVWGKSLITGKPGEWFIVRIVEMSKSWFIAFAGATQGFGDKDTYGMTWLAYRFPTEDRNVR